jgi:hypothetical protein
MHDNTDDDVITRCEVVHMITDRWQNKQFVWQALPILAGGLGEWAGSQVKRLYQHWSRASYSCERTVTTVEDE